MRVSPRRHVLVLLREAIGIGQKEFAAAVGMGESTVQKIELGTYPLRPRIAEKIASYTGVDINYLTRNDFNEPLLNWQGDDYEKSDFEAAQGQQRTPAWIEENFEVWDYKSVRLSVAATFLNSYYRMRSMFLGDPNAWDQFHRFQFRLIQLLDETIKEAEPEAGNALLWERVRQEVRETTQKQRLLTTRGDIDELLDVIAVLEKRTKKQKPGATIPPPRRRVKGSPSAHRPKGVRSRARRVSSSPDSGRR